MDDSMLEDSVFDDDGGSSDFAPEPAPKPKAKAAPKKAAAAKPATKKTTQTTLKVKPAAKAAATRKKKADSEDEVSDIQMSDDDSLLSHTPPKTKKTAVSKRAGSKPLADVENESHGGDAAADSKTGNASDKYQKLTQLEHIIKRPDTYIGSTERTTQHMWVYNSGTEAMEYREVSFVPGLYKIFDEIVVNAADNKHNDSSMNEMRITIDREAGEISVWNNGRGIPIEIHSREKIYVPELIFGHLLTSSNYDDSQQKVTGGRNGFGAKLCNVFSTEFTLETQDSRQKKKYKQTWTENMTKMGKAKITDAKGDDYTKVTFKPDFARFGMDGIDDDFEALVMRRVYDLAGTANVGVKLNGTRVPVRNFRKYMEMYTKAIRKERDDDGPPSKDEIITCQPDPRWEIGFAVSDGSFQQVSFVNSIATTSGGTHVNYIADQICTRLADQVKKKNKSGATLKSAQIRNHIFIFVKALIVNPAFNSQTKEQLTTKASQFGSKCSLDEDFYKKVLKTEVMSNILHFAEQKADQILKKSETGRRTRMNNPKLVDANKAGTREGHHCTLILTEGDSAKGLAMAGRAVVGPDLFGVFPLRGKLLNVRDASFDQISKNVEIQSIKNFIGLQHKKEYTETKGLRYGHIMIMTDQDHDGSHIKGLLINFLQAQFPSLLKIPEFLIEFITPIIKVWKGDPKNPTKQKSFFTMPEHDEWRQAHKHERGWQHKYYKGLGTSTTEDAQVYFRDLDRHLKEFHTMQDGEAGLIELAFSKKKADERKEWLRQYKPGTYLDHSVAKITYTDFINKELILFSMADNQRSIPSVVDGLKPGQRKVLHTCFIRNLKKDMKVVELAGHVSGMTAYQHGDVSLQQTIVGLAQTFVGSNNINCLEPSGNFGSRLQGGGDCASARYIYTRLSPFARKIFHAADEPLLTYNEDDGKKIEPEVFIPVVPMILINGADGIGTGWSSSIPNYNPEDVVNNLKRLMAGEPTEPMQPWFRGFTGEVVAVGGDRYKFSGIIRECGEKEVEITELPLRTWTQDFKDKLEEIIKAEKVPSFIKDYRDYNTHTKVHFIIQLDEKHMKAALSEGLEEKFKLTKSIATTNLVAFDPEGRITKYATVDDILKEFYVVRLKYYERRKQFQLSNLQRELEKLSNQARFVQMIIDGKLVISKKKKPVLITELKEKGFKPIAKVAEAAKMGEDEAVVEEGLEEGEDESDDPNAEVLSSSFDYLLGMPMWSLTQERVEKLRSQIGEKETEVDVLIKLSKEDIWNRDLEEFIKEWRFQLEDEDRRARKEAGLGCRVPTKLATGGGRVAASRKRKAANGDDPDDEDFGVPKVKKAAAAKKKEQPKNSLMNFLSKPPSKSSPSADSDDDFNMDMEILPKKSRATSKPKTLPKQEDDFVDIDNVPQASRASAHPADDTMDLDEDEMPKPKVAAKAAVKPAAKRGPKPKPKVEEDSDDDFLEIAKSEASKPAVQSSRARKPVKYSVPSDSDSDNGDDLLGDVSMMVKGIGGDPTADSRQLFSERPRSESGASVKTTAKTSKANDDFDPDETDYSKLVPQNSPRRSIQVKPKDVKLDDNDEDDEEQPVKPAARAKAVPKAKAAPKTAPKDAVIEDDDDEEDEPIKPIARGKAAPKAKAAPKTAAATSAPKARGRPKKEPAPKPVPKSAPPTLSPAAKAYASKQGKASKKIVDDYSEDDIDAMANDILDSPAGKVNVDISEDEEPAPALRRAAASRPARRGATKQKNSYVIEDDSDEEASADDFDEDEDDSD
ncbi:DNA topoisomerase 2 [Penicillium digitatum]|uniref:DNA topoisomerase 2 n=3 Tax=Penicillium digitatum TaxID=36651 RepID=K9FFX4_PEND2|nr:DNA topoisomerase 2 [Penicillium digitatum Pd1]EKV07062.1 DNA topoisomerase 2 [Penicillium digitatum PHI26]EKV13939.1 DNA topoisomerase 2 [Penicillium digitatum Pd1]QQK46280.1 DNA topoisomerase 2 [Penicillium digitatum]